MTRITITTLSNKSLLSQAIPKINLNLVKAQMGWGGEFTPL